MSMLADIYANLPHAGDMRLLEQVLHWDEQSIVCADVQSPLDDEPAAS